MKLRNKKSTSEKSTSITSSASSSHKGHFNTRAITTSNHIPNVHNQNSKVTVANDTITLKYSRESEKGGKCVEDAKSSKSAHQSTKSVPAIEAGAWKGRNTLTSKQYDGEERVLTASSRTKGDHSDGALRRLLSEVFLPRMRLFCGKCGVPRVCHAIDARSRLVCQDIIIAKNFNGPGVCEVCGQKMIHHQRGACPYIDAEARMWILLEEGARECARCDKPLLFHECIGRERKVVCPCYAYGPGVKAEEDKVEDGEFASNTVKEAAVESTARTRQHPVCTKCHKRMKGHKRNGAKGKWICPS